MTMDYIHWMDVLKTYPTLSDALSDYYDGEGAFSAYSPITNSIVEYAKRQGITCTLALEELYSLYKMFSANRL